MNIKMSRDHQYMHDNASTITKKAPHIIIHVETSLIDSLAEEGHIMMTLRGIIVVLLHQIIGTIVNHKSIDVTVITWMSIELEEIFPHSVV